MDALGAQLKGKVDRGDRGGTIVRLRFPFRSLGMPSLELTLLSGSTYVIRGPTNVGVFAPGTAAPCSSTRATTTTREGKSFEPARRPDYAYLYRQHSSESRDGVI